MLTDQQINILEEAWELLDSLRNSREFNESHDLTIADASRVISEFLDWHQEQEHKQGRKKPPVVVLASLEAFNNL